MTGTLKKKHEKKEKPVLFVSSFTLSREKNNLKLCTEDIWKCLSDLKKI